MLRETRRHPNLDQAVIPDGIRVTDNLKESMESKDLLVMAVPSVYVRQTAAKMRPFLRPGQIVTNVAKGIEEASLLPLSQVIEAELPDAQVTVLSGPSHAEEVSRGLPTTCVSGSSRRQPAEYVQSLFMNEFFRVYTSPDVLGIELGGALKNVDRSGSGHCRRPGLRGQHEGGLNYQGHCGDHAPWRGDGRKGRDPSAALRASET